MAGSNLPYLSPLLGRNLDTLGSLFREVEKTFEDFSRRAPWPGFGDGGAAPKIDVAEGSDGIDVIAELPGVDEKDIEVTIADGMLTIRGEKRAEREEGGKDKNWHVVERTYGAFSRSIPLPYDPDSGKAEAKFENGVLRIHLPKPAEIARKEKKIEITKV
jgi:HSP20 family protein